MQKLTESNIGELFTTDGKDVIKFMAIEQLPVYYFKDLNTGISEGHTESDIEEIHLKRLIPEPRKYERKQVTPPEVLSNSPNELEEGLNQEGLTLKPDSINVVDYLKPPKRTRKPKGERALCNDCALFSNCVPAENLKPDNTCLNFCKK